MSLASKTTARAEAQVTIPRHYAIDIHHQPHLLDHQTVEQYLDNHILHSHPENEPEEDILDREEMIRTGSIWMVYRWTSTLGHYFVMASTLEKALAAVEEDS